MKETFVDVILVTSVISGLVLMASGIVGYAPLFPLGATILAVGCIWSAIVAGDK